MAALAATSAGIHQTTNQQVTAFVDSHWRGAYDVLVRPHGSRLDLSTTQGLVESDFISFGGRGGISLDTLKAIRSIQGVDLAAPIAFVGAIRSDSPTLSIHVTNMPSKPTLYRVTATVAIGDGLSSQVIQGITGEVLLGPAATGDDVTAHWVSSLGDKFGGLDEHGQPILDLSVGKPLPDVSAPVIAVDPSAEAQLLGGASFLDPLGLVGDQALTASSFDSSLIPDAYWLQQLGIQNASGDTPVVPLVVADRVSASVTASMSIEQIGHPLDQFPGGSGLSAITKAEQLAGSGYAAVGSASADASDTLAPFSLVTLTLTWPGSSGPSAQGGYLQRNSNVTVQLLDRPSYEATERSGPDPNAPSFAITPLGPVGIDGQAVQPGEASFQSYRQISNVSVVAGGSVSGSGRPFLIAPIGTFDPRAIAVPSDKLTYVPLGAYDPADTTYIAGPDGKAVEPKPMLYPLLLNGLVSMPPLAITNMAGAVTLRGSSPIDAVRVRVAGLSDYGPDAQAKIKDVAEAISRLGLDVDIVAGSSPQNVDIYVPEYNVTQPTPSDLGWVRQHWTTIGAAARVSHGFTDSDLALLVVDLFAAAVWAFALAGLRSERRIREVAILKTIGWGRLRILRWLLGEPTVGAATIGLLAAAAFLVGHGTTEALTVGLGMAVLWVAVGFVFALDTLRRADPSRIGSVGTGAALMALPPVSGPISYALRAALARWPWVLTTAAGLAAGSGALALGCATLVGLSARIGPTLLASAAAAAVAGYLPLALGVVACGSLVFAAAGLRLEHRRRSAELLVLSASGWEKETIDRLVLAGRVITGMIAAILALLVTAILAVPFTIRPVLPVAAAAALLAASVVVWGGLLTWRDEARPGVVQ